MVSVRQLLPPITKSRTVAISLRLMMGFILFLSLISGLLLTIYSHVSSIQVQTQRALEVELTQFVLVNNILDRANFIEPRLRNILLDKSPEYRAMQIERIGEARRQIVSYIQRVQPLFNQDEHRILFDRYIESRAVYGREIEFFLDEVGRGSDEAAALRLKGPLVRAQENYHARLADLLSTCSQSMTESGRVALHSADTTQKLIIILGVGFFVLSLVFVYLVIRWVTRPVEKETQRLLQAVEQSPVSIVMTDRQGNINYVNPRFVWVTGYDPDEVIGKNPRILQSGDTPAHVFETMWESILSGKEWRGFLHNRRKNGEKFWEEAVISPILDTKKQITGFIAVKEDITDRKQAEEDLHRWHTMLNNTGKVARVGGWALDIDSSTLTWSDEVFRIHEMEPSNLPSMELALSFYVAEDRPVIERAINDAILHGKSWDLELRQVSAKNRTLWIRSQGTAEIHEGKVIRIYGALHDITAYKEIQGKLREQQELLEHKVSERTSDLVEALDLARQAGQAKDRFLANVSHELRTPLNAVIGLSGLALSACKEPKLRDYLEKITGAGQTLLDIINDLLDVSKMASGQLAIELQPFHLRDVVAHCFTVVSHRAIEKKLDFRLNYPDDVPNALVGDPFRIEQILTNLLNNAVKFTSSGFVELKVSCEGFFQDRASLCLSVRDSGIGIAPSDIHKLFQPFSQADASISRRFGGTGLGLSICRLLAEKMGGHISVSSEPGVGSTFELRLVLAQVHDMADSSTEKSTSVQSSKIHYHDVRILLAEDQPMNRQVVEELLQAVGISVDMVENGRQAVDKLLSVGPGAYGLVLMDLQMPEMDGLTATRLIRENEAFRSLPILAMTAHAMEHERQITLEAGMNDHIGKPFQVQRFYEMIERWLPECCKKSATPPVKTSQTASASLTAIATPLIPGTDDLPGLPALQGVDTAAGLARFAGKKDRYARWLNDFIVQGPQTIEKITESLENNTPEGRKNSLALIHAFKGRVGMLGMQRFHGYTQTLEQVLKEEQPYRQALDEWQREGRALAQEIEKLLALPN